MATFDSAILTLDSQIVMCGGKTGMADDEHFDKCLFLSGKESFKIRSMNSKYGFYEFNNQSWYNFSRMEGDDIDHLKSQGNRINKLSFLK